MKLEEAARYVRGETRSLPALVASIRRIMNFPAERANRLARYIVVTRAYENGEHVDRIVNRYGCGRTTVLRYARLAGIAKRPKHLPEEIRRSVLREYRAGVPVATIALTHDVSQAYVSTVAGKEGLTRRKR